MRNKPTQNLINKGVFTSKTNIGDDAGCTWIVVLTLTNTSAVWVTLIGKSISGTATLLNN